MDSCIRAYSNVQQLLCHGGYCELILSLARTSCRLLFTARPTARPLAGNPLCDVVRSRNSSKSTLVHDAVATAVLHKHHSIIHVGAGLIQFVYRSHLRWGTEANRNRNAFSPFFPQVFELCNHIHLGKFKCKMKSSLQSCCVYAVGKPLLIESCLFLKIPEISQKFGKKTTILSITSLHIISKRSCKNCFF